MRKPWRFAFVALLVFLTSASFGQLAFEVDFTYYSDGTFTTLVGDEDHACDGNVYSWGSTSDWRIRDRYSCLSVEHVSHGCFELIDGSWTSIPCPPGV